MSIILRLRRRLTGAAGAPLTLNAAEPSYNEVDDILYYGKGDVVGTASSVIAIAGPGAFVDRSLAQTIGGIKTFSVSPVGPTAGPADSSTKLATTAFVQGELTNYVANSQKGVANGVVPLDGTTKIAATYLPSYIDDVLEFATLVTFPVTGEAGKIYVDLATNREYRWSGSTYIQLVSSPGTTDNVPEGILNVYHTSSRVLSTVLLGLSVATSSAITVADTVLSALGKLQAQISLRLVASNDLSDLGNAGTARTNLGLGTMATQAANNVNISGGTIDNVILDGGTF